MFVRDLDTGVIERVSVWTDGRQGELALHEQASQERYLNQGSVSLSADGSVVGFSTYYRLHEDDPVRATSVDPVHLWWTGYSTDEIDAYIHDRRTGTTIMARRDHDGRLVGGMYPSFDAHVSADGTKVLVLTAAP